MKKENASVAAETENNATKNVYNPEYLVDIQHERLSFFTPAGEVKALNDVSLYVRPGEVLGIVGESGSGKSVTAYSLMGLTAHPGRLIGGDIWFSGHHINDMAAKTDEITQAFLGKALSREIFGAPASFGGYQQVDTASFFC